MIKASLSEAQQALTSSFNASPIPGLEIRVGPSRETGLEMRLEYQGTKTTLPIHWSDSTLWKNQASHLKSVSPDCILCAPFLSEYAAELYREELGLNHADCNGRFFLQHGSILIDRSPRLSEHSNPPQEASGFSLKGTRILRALLHESSRIWTQADLVKATQCSAGYVSRVLKTFLRQGLVTKQGFGGRGDPIEYRVPRPELLLAAWKREDRFDKRVRTYRFSCLEPNHDRLVRILHESLSDVQHAFTQWTAAWLRRPTTPPHAVSVYMPEETLHWFKPGSPVDSGGNLHVLVPEDEGNFQCLQTVDDLPLVCDAQIYLDLIDRGFRGPEAAEALRGWEDFGKNPPPY
jgi:hypothetical protein